MKSNRKIKISVLIPGNISDKGFMQAGYEGYKKIKNLLHVDTDYISMPAGIKDPNDIVQKLREMAESKPDLIIAHGGQCESGVKIIASEFPDIKFTVIQGNIKGNNISSYSVKQQDANYLAGVLAGLMTKTDIVGHIAGSNPKSLLTERAAFYQGLVSVNPDVTFLSAFTGSLEDPEINKKAAEAEIEKGADIIYSALNLGRPGVIEAVKNASREVYNIGNVYDWTLEDDSFIAAAVADSSVALFKAASDVVFNKWKPNDAVEIGLDHPETVRLSMGAHVPEGVKEKISEITKLFVEGGIDLSNEYSGKEFNISTGELE